jgi:hypothetical protein
MKRILFSMLGLGFVGLVLTFAIRNMPVPLQGETKEIFATLEPECDPGQVETLWTWTITGFDVYDPALAPDHITVEWTDGNEIVPHRGFTGTGFAKYSTDSHGTDVSPYVGASAIIFVDWEGIFRISHPVCPLEGTPTPTQPPPPADTPTPTAPASSSTPTDPGTGPTDTPTPTTTGGVGIPTETPTPTTTGGVGIPTETPTPTSGTATVFPPVGSVTATVGLNTPPVGASGGTPTAPPLLPTTGESPLNLYLGLEWFFGFLLIALLAGIAFRSISRTKSQ